MNILKFKIQDEADFTYHLNKIKQQNLVNLDTLKMLKTIGENYSLQIDLTKQTSINMNSLEKLKQSILLLQLIENQCKIIIEDIQIQNSSLDIFSA
jgi:hypothetical protein